MGLLVGFGEHNKSQLGFIQGEKCINKASDYYYYYYYYYYLVCEAIGTAATPYCASLG
jgi:hypothetical protein